MYEIIRVGIPIQSAHITDEFLQVVENIKNKDDCIAITLIDYPIDIMNCTDAISAPAGYRILTKNLKFIKFENTFKPNVINTCGFVLGLPLDKLKKHNIKIVEYILSLIEDKHKELNFKTVYMFTPGSPTCGDRITECLLEKVDLKIIETVSSLDISLKSMKDFVGNLPHIERHYHYEFIDRMGRFTPEQLAINKKMDIGKLNVFNCLSDLYNVDNIPLMERFLEDVSLSFSESDLLLSCTVNEEGTDLKVFSIAEARLCIDDFRFSKKPFTIGICKKERQNDHSTTIS